MSGLREEQSPGADVPAAAAGRAVPDLLFTIDREGRILEFHAPPQRRLRMPPERFLGKKADEFLPPATARLLQESLRRTLEQGPQPGVVIPISFPEGERWYEAFVVPPGRREAGAGRLQVILCDITEQRRAEAALAESEVRHRRLFENLSDAFVRVDMAGRLLEYNREYELLTGYPAAELGQLTYVDLTPECWRGLEARIIVEQVLPRGYSDIYQKEYRRKDGTLVPVELRTVLLRDATGAPAGMWAILRDISAAKHAEASLRESEAKYRQLFENMQDGIATGDLSGRIIESNAAFQALTGYTAEELRELTYVDLTPEKWRELDERIMAEQVLARGYSDAYEKEYLCKDGTIIPVVIRTVLVRDEAGRPVRAWALVRDNTIRRRAEEKLCKSEAKFRELFETIRDAIVRSDLQGQIVETNAAFRALTGYTAEELAGKTRQDLVAPDDQTRIRQGVVEQLLPRGYTDLFAARILRKDGTFVPVEIQSHLIRDAAGRPAGVWATVRDITERERIESELFRSRELLDATQRLAHVGGWEWDIARQTMYWTDETYRIHGLRPGELAAGSPEHIERSLACYDPADRPVIAEAFRGCAAEGRPYDREFLLTRVDGRRVWIRTMAHAVRDGDRMAKVVGTIMDITERKRAEGFLRQVLDLIPAGVFWKDRDSVFLGCNQAIARAAGLADPAQIVGKTDYDLGWKKEESDYYVAMDRWVMENDQAEMHIIEPQLQAGGKEIWLDTCKIPLHDEEGRVIGILGAFQDITEHRNMTQVFKDLAGELERRVRARTTELEASQRALARSEEQFRQMAESVDEIFWLLDVRTQAVLYVNSAFERIWGRPHAEVSRDIATWMSHMHAGDREHVRQIFARGLATGIFDPVEYRVVHPDGRIRWVADRAWPIRDAGGNIVRVAGVSRDITEHRRLEAEILRAAEAERQRIGRDLHDGLGQSLAAIGYWIEGLRERFAKRSLPEAAELQKLVQRLSQAAGQAHALAQGLLLTDLERGGLIPALQELARTIGELYGVECRYAGPDHVRLPDSDTASQLYCIAQEAATNAAKHARGDQITIQLARRRDGLRLSIRDNGRGLSEPLEPGNGLGLEIMRYRASMVGATLTIESNAGRGTVVTCRLPRPAAASPPPQPA